MYVNAGELDKRITVYRRPELEEDGYLPENPEPAPVHACWAKYSQVSGTELARNGADFGEARVRFLIRWTSREIDRKMFVRYRGRDYEILYVNTYGDSGEYLELWCKWLSNEAAAGQSSVSGGAADSSFHCAAVGGFAALRMRRPPCGEEEP